MYRLCEFLGALPLIISLLEELSQSDNGSDLETFTLNSLQDKETTGKG